MFRYKLSSTLLVPIILLAGMLGTAAQTATTAKAKAPAAGQSEKKNVPASKGQGGEGQDLASADLRAIKKPPLPEFHPQQPKRVQLSNGMVIFLQEDHELPLIDGGAYVRGGSVTEPAEKIGLVSIYGQA